jgi:hypothetical protein
VGPSCRRRGRGCLKLVTLASPFRLVIHPIVDYVLKVEKENAGRTIAVVIATMVERHWYHYFLHNQRADILTALLLLGGDERINIVNVPWYLGVRQPSAVSKYDIKP